MTTNTPPEPLLTTHDLAAYLRVTPGTIRTWRTRGDGPPAVRVAGSVRWRRADVDAWLDGHSEQTPTAGGAR